MLSVAALLYMMPFRTASDRENACVNEILADHYPTLNTLSVEVRRGLIGFITKCQNTLTTSLSVEMRVR